MRRRTDLDDHLGRILILLRHFGSEAERPLQGLTKLAKLDFLLRYPVFTERLMDRRGLDWTLGAEPAEDERLAVESRMVRYKYGPWDDRYYPILGALIGLGFARVWRDKLTYRIALTAEGKAQADQLRLLDDWAAIDARSEFLATNFNLTGSRLKTMIYEELPDVVDRPLRTKI